MTTRAVRPANAGSVIGSPVRGITGSAGIVVDVEVDAAVVVDAWLEVVAADSVVLVGVDSATVVAGAESPSPPHAARTSAAMISVVDLVYFTVLSAVQLRSFERGMCDRSCSRAGRNTFVT